MDSRIIAATTLACLVAPAFANAQSADTVESVIVTASRVSDDPPIVAATRERLSRTPGAVAIVAAESYETRLAVGMPDLLRDVPGVLSNKRYGEESRLSIRGSGIDQAYHQRGVLIAQDGVPFADADGFSDFQKVDALGARYIEVYKGGNALRFGGAQLGGAVNLVTPNGRTAESANLLRVETGSFGTVRGAGAFARTLGDWDLYASISALQTDGYREHSAQEQVRGTLNIGRSFGEDRDVRVILYRANVDQEVPGTLGLSDALNRPERAGAGVVENDWARDQDTTRVTLQTHWRFNDALIFEGGLYTTNTDVHHPIPIVIDQSIDTQGAFGRLDWSGEVAGHKADLFAGVYYRRGRNDQGLFVNDGGRNGFQFGDGRQRAAALDVFAEGRWFATEHFALVAGGSYGRASRDYRDNLNATNDAQKNFDWFAPRLGILWQNQSGVQVYGNVTRSVEPPHYGALVQTPYPGFVPVASQEAWTVEAGTRGRSGALTWDVALYRSQLEGELLSFNAASGYPAAFFNAGRTVHQGLEASLDWHIADLARSSLTLRQTYAWSDFHFDDDPVYGGNRLPVVPQHQYRLVLKWLHASGFYVEPALDWRMSAVQVDYANTLRAPAYALVNLGVGWRSGSLSLFVDGRNLTDKRYVSEFGAVTDARIAQTSVFYPGEGRSAFAGASWRF